MVSNKDISMKEVKERTGLSSRQIRYYDQENLIFPDRSEGNQRLFSEADIRRLKEIKKLINKGYNVDTIKKKLKIPQTVKSNKNKTTKYHNKADRLKSLYPVSDRSFLVKMLDKNKEEKNE